MTRTIQRGYSTWLFNMSNRCWHWALRYCCLLILLTANAQGLRQFQSLSIEQGLSQSVVTSIAQDSQGLLWFGTQDGLNRYDGTQFKVFRHRDGDGQSLPDNDITRVQTDHNNELWIATASGAAHLPTGSEQFEVLALAPNALASSIDKMVLSFAFGPDTQVWVGTANGLWLFDRATKQMMPAAAAENLERLQERRVRELFYEKKANRLWIGTDKGVQWLDVASGQWQRPERLQELAITRFLPVDENNILIGTRHGAYLYHIGNAHLRTLASEFIRCTPGAVMSGNIQDLYRDSNGDFWLATADGVVVTDLDFKQCEFYQHKNREPLGLNASDVLSVFEDRSGVLWLGSFAGGLNRWNTRAKLFNHVLAADLEPELSASHAVMASLRDSQGGLWVGTSDLGLLYKPEPNKAFQAMDLHTAYRAAHSANNAFVHAQPSVNRSVVVPEKSFSENTSPDLVDIDITNLLEDQFGDLWIGTNVGLFYRKSSANGLDASLTLMNSVVQLTDNPYVSSLFEDSRGQLWLGNYSGLRRINRVTATTFNVDIFDDKLPPDWRASLSEVTSISDDRYGNLWLAGSAGILRCSADFRKFHRYHAEADKAERLTSNEVLSLLINRDDSVWAGTSNGLVRLHTQDGEHYSSERFNIDTGFPFSTVYALLPGADATIWLATNAGLVRFDPVQRHFMRFRHEDGLLSDEFNVRAHSINADGEHLFGGIAGVVSFYDENLVPAPVPLPPVLVGWRIFDRVQAIPETGKAIRINSDDRVVMFDFAVPDYVAPARNQLRYRVRGLHDDWINLEGGRSITLTGLSAQNYELEVQGISAGGASSSTSHWRIAVDGPFWSFHRLYLSIFAATMVLLLAFFWWLNTRYRRGLMRERMGLLNANQDLQLMQRDNSELRNSHRDAQAALNLSHQQQQELALQLDQMSSIDMLTGLGNRHGLLIALGSGLEQQRCAGLLLLDLDGLRGINERYGWSVGDQVIVQLADMLARMQSESTLIFRVYADVLAILPKPGTDLVVLAERIRSAILQKAFHIASRRRIDMTCCIGFVVTIKVDVSLEPDAEQPAVNNAGNDTDNATVLLAEHAPEILIAIAERGIALAKKNGRNAWVGFQLSESVSVQDFKRQWPKSLQEACQSGAIVISTSLPGGADGLQW